jgi:hypothetical protein
MQCAVSITIEEEVFSIRLAYIYYWATDMFSMVRSRDYISSIEPSSQHWTRRAATQEI